jgi:hypothetical protein
MRHFHEPAGSDHFDDPPNWQKAKGSRLYKICIDATPWEIHWHCRYTQRGAIFALQSEATLAVF